VKVIYASSQFAALRDRDGWVDLVRSDGEIKALGGHSSADVIRTVASFAALGSISPAGCEALDLFLTPYFV
jgi:hypothetical protein